MTGCHWMDIDQGLWGLNITTCYGSDWNGHLDDTKWGWHNESKFIYSQDWGYPNFVTLSKPMEQMGEFHTSSSFRHSLTPRKPLWCERRGTTDRHSYFLALCKSLLITFPSYSRVRGYLDKVSDDCDFRGLIGQFLGRDPMCKFAPHIPSEKAMIVSCQTSNCRHYPQLPPLSTLYPRVLTECNKTDVMSFTYIDLYLTLIINLAIQSARVHWDNN